MTIANAPIAPTRAQRRISRKLGSFPRPIQSGVVAHGLELLTFVVRFSGDAPPVAGAFRDVVAGVDSTRPVTHIQPLQQYVDDQLGGFRQYVILLGLFGTVAVVLAIVGTYGLMAHAVSLRVHEIGIRMALGASRRRALWLILRRGLVLSSVGLTLGLLGGVMFTTVLESYLWEVTSTDPATFSTVPMTLGAVSLLGVLSRCAPCPEDRSGCGVPPVMTSGMWS